MSCKDAPTPIHTAGMVSVAAMVVSVQLETSPPGCGKDILVGMDRYQLMKLIEADEGANWWVPEKFEEHVRSHLPPELHIVAPPPPESQNHNCFVFAFGLEDDPDFLDGKNPVQQEFVRYLLNQGILQKGEPKDGNMIFYENDDRVITHAGRLRSGREVISKWMWGPTIVHDIWDVPSSFGNAAFYCEKLPPTVIKDEYENYKSTGAEIRPIS